ncbi:tRNA-dihydrouridine synthase family protein [Lachnospiraceae bacterium 45-P1]
MEFYFAPLEGITSYTYRNLHHKYYSGVEKYYTPFLSPGPETGLGIKQLRDVIPENNPDILLVPQLLTNRAGDFLKSMEVLGEYGYQEINLNLGCPSGTVTAKKKGSGFLCYPQELDRFLDEVFKDRRVWSGEFQVSVKTRIGKNSPEEWTGLMEIYNRYPLKELIIHPRIQRDFYNNTPNLEVFGSALAHSKNPVVYNGDIFSDGDFGRFREKFPTVETVMLGRGLVQNPELAWALKEERSSEIFDKTRLKNFHDELLRQYCELMSGERNVLFRMKELWFYMIRLFPDKPKTEKKIKKAVRLAEYRAAVDELLA